MPSGRKNDTKRKTPERRKKDTRKKEKEGRRKEEEEGRKKKKEGEEATHTPQVLGRGVAHRRPKEQSGLKWIRHKRPKSDSETPFSAQVHFGTLSFHGPSTQRPNHNCLATINRGIWGEGAVKRKPSHVSVRVARLGIICWAPRWTRHQSCVVCVAGWSHAPRAQCGACGQICVNLVRIDLRH